MSLKNNIKNKYWHINWIIPLSGKYLVYGKREYIKRTMPIIKKTKIIHGKGTIADDYIRLAKAVDIIVNNKRNLFYNLDINKTIITKGVVLGNFTLDYSKIIQKDFYSLIEESKDNEAFKIKEAIECLYDRIIEKLNSVENNSCINNQLSNLQGMLNSKADHFAEGLQRVLFFNSLLWQTRHRLNGLGRLDFILNELYVEDKKAGFITREKALEFIIEFLTILHDDYEYKSAAMLGDVGQIIVLGGLNPDGSYFESELTSLFIEAVKKVNFPDPKILLRVSSKMPEKLLREATETLKIGCGSPLFSNDDVIIPLLINKGFDEEDAYKYVVSACWEPFICGKSLDQNNMFTFDFWSSFCEYMSAFDKEPDDWKTFYEGYLRLVEKQASRIKSRLDDVIWAKDPLVSLFTEDCRKTGKDISEGGSKYNNYGITTVGMASLCNSLVNIKKIVFDEKTISLLELENDRKNNFNDNDKLFIKLKNMPKAFGHDDEEAVSIVTEILKAFNKGIESKKNRLGGDIKFGLSAPDYLKIGVKSEADLCGRHSNEPYSTHISANDAVYTELVNFASDISYPRNGINGNVIDFFVTPDLINNNSEKFVLFLKYAINKGFYQMQMNVVSSKTLIDAKNNPDKYPGLIVRVWGFSAYFNDLSDDYKNLLINRAIENERVNN